MNRMDLTFTVNTKEQTIARTDHNTLVADSVYYVYAVFTIDDIAGLTFAPLFSKLGVTPQTPSPTIEGNVVSCLVPPQMLSAGVFRTSIVGTTADGGRITFKDIAVSVEPSGYKEGSGVQPPEYSVYEQILQQLDELSTNLSSQVATDVEKYFVDHPAATQTQIEQWIAEYVTAHKAELKGDAGYSPSANVTQTSTGATITITDSTGTSTATVSNGKDGDPGTPGADGMAATISVGTVTTGVAGTSASVSNKGTANAAVLDFTIPAGADGKDGKDMTAQGETVTNTGAVTKALTANKFCNFTGAITTLTITLPATYNPWDEFNFCFTTDSTGGNLALPSTVSWLGGTTPTLSASTYYECSIVNNKAVIAP